MTSHYDIRGCKNGTGIEVINFLTSSIDGGCRSSNGRHTKGLSYCNIAFMSDEDELLDTFDTKSEPLIVLLLALWFSVLCR